jgi:hemerythrin superfamily protein
MPSDVVTLLLEDHQEAKRALQTFEDADRARWAELFRKLADTLVRHEVAEEVVVYPVLRDEPGGAAIADARIAEQAEAEDLLSQMEQMDPTSDEFAEAFSTLQSAVLEHAGSEEAEVLPLLQEQEPSERLVEMGKRYTKVKSFAPDGGWQSIAELADTILEAARPA